MLDLLDYRRQISALYAAVRDGGSCENTHQLWRDARDELFSRHPQSALGTEQKKAFAGLNYFPYDSAYDVLGEFQATASGKSLTVMLGGDGETRLLPIGRVRFALPAGVAALTAYWIEGYGGGLFIPFGDASNGATTYGGGRYLYDSIKGADLGERDGKLVMNFNYAYYPSCAYNARWTCPLPPAENQLSFAIPAGEKFLSKP